MPSVRALLHERDGYVRAGKTDRVAQVDAELARLGFAADDDLVVVEETVAPVVVERAVKRGSRRR